MIVILSFGDVWYYVPMIVCGYMHSLSCTLCLCECVSTRACPCIVDFVMSAPACFNTCVSVSIGGPRESEMRAASHLQLGSLVASAEFLRRVSFCRMCVSSAPRQLSGHIINKLRLLTRRYG